ncbi:MAG: protein jag [Syntrophales bacterium]|nr:protein jag [Syntrophales bacterium]
MKKSLEFEAKTIDEAIEQACRELNLSRDKLNIEILSEGSPGFLGLVGARKARIRAGKMSIDIDFDNALPETPTGEVITERKSGDMANEARSLLEGILSRMGFDFPVTAEEEEEEEENFLVLNIQGDGSGILIGKGVQTLDALQYIVNKALNKNGTDRKRVVLDTENYREKRESSLVALALKLGEKAKRTKKPVTVNPMNAHDRRIVHLALQNDKDLLTRSRGNGDFRKIIIVPGKKS